MLEIRHCTVQATCCISSYSGAAPPECTDGEIRLVNGTTERNGRVEMCYGGIWGSVCNHFWDDTDASVVCRELGHNSTGNVPPIYIVVSACKSTYIIFTADTLPKDLLIL